MLVTVATEDGKSSQIEVRATKDSCGGGGDGTG